ncbi:hypothetical protein PLESTB_000691000 [Pleodorina starrii]|uniref:Cytidyltransferase-like domain-containing protein n=1 Tax=Pleodorina starrii TaxID=330485 RepID=A0A9W6BJL0_9CHLO|nr:hypothetical protein PLESTM_001226300 [Pleodorina starrii]GLC52945.1 hypothetical protein PLESTB_000691000 [Pleodorina starrii]GLC65240.1 hypothetical protein PLESTF_000267200 [Pleodorina starrii]
MFQVASLRRFFSQKRGVTFATAIFTAAAIGATSEHTAAADGPKTAPGVGADTPPTSGDAVPLPTDKLSCKMGVRPPRAPVVLVCCGSFNPPTIMHMRMVDLASDELLKRGYDVWGAYLSPVADAYGKAGLAPAADRVAMCRLAAEDESRRRHVVPEPGSGQLQAAATPSHPDPTPNLTMAYDWEARQPGYTRTLAVMRRVESELRSWVTGAPEPAPGPSDGAPAAAGGGGIRESAPSPGESSLTIHDTPPQSPPAATVTASPSPALRLHPPSPPPSSPPLQQPDDGVHPPPPVRAMLLCGGDVLASMAVPGVWRDPDVILGEHGVVCVAREGTDLERLLTAPGSVLYDYRDRIIVVYDRVGNSVSSSKVRHELAAGRPVRYLVTPSVLSYIFEKGLYGTRRDGES